METAALIELENISKTYPGSLVAAVDDLSLAIPLHARFGLLGPNGAGKTTTISILCGLLQYDSGHIRINGMSLEKKYRKIRKMIGLVPQDIALYESLTARENLRFIGEMYGLKGKGLRDRIDESLEKVGLIQYASKAVKAFSGGMKRRINLVAGMLHEPEILILDEPTSGVDVQSRSLILQLLFELNEKGTTIIYTSHYLEEAEELCNHIAIIDAGKVIIKGETAGIINGHAGCNNLESVFLHLTGRKLRD